MEPTRPPRSLRVLREAPPALWQARVDWSSWTLSDAEAKAPSPLREAISLSLRSAIAGLIEQRGGGLHVGGRQLFAWMPDEPLVRVCPDVYLLEGAPPASLPKGYQTWRPDHRPPLFALEVVTDWRRDYELLPQKHAALGVRELVIVDPAPDTREPAQVPLQVYRTLEDGAFAEVYHGPGPCRSSALDAWIVLAGQGAQTRLRLVSEVDGGEPARNEAGQERGGGA